jgi:hypothetical protein
MCSRRETTIEKERHERKEDRDEYPRSDLYWLLGTSVRKKPLEEGESVPSLVADGCAPRVQFEDVNMCSQDNLKINGFS